MSSRQRTLNPYQVCCVPAECAEWTEVNPTAGCHIVRVRKQLLYREITIRGFLETTICWDGRGTMELIRVAGRKVAEKFSWWYVTRFDFLIPTAEGTVPATIEVSQSWLLFTSRFRLTLGSEVVYEESLQIWG